MRTTNQFLLALIIFSMSLSGCGQSSGNKTEKENKQPEELVIAGEIENPKGNEVTVKQMPDGSSKTYSLSDKGSFEGTFPLSEPAYLKLTHKEYTNCYGEPGDSIYLTLNTEKFDETLEYSGAKATINNYLASKILLGDSVSLMDSRKAMRNLYSKSPEDFTKHVDSVYKIYKKHFKDHFKDKSISATFKQYEKVNLDAQFYQRKLQYPGFYNRVTDKEAPEVPEDFYAFMDEISLDKPEYLDIPKFSRYLSVYLRDKQSDLQEKDSAFVDTNYNVVYQETVQEYIPNDTIKARLIGSHIERRITRYGVEPMKPLLTYYEELPYQKEQKATIDTLKQERMKISEGKDAPGFTYPTVDGDTVSLSDLEGSYVYIDAWATWCGPCLKEIPHLKELHNDMKDQNIKFVSISLDKGEDKSKWKKMIENRDMKGIQLIAKGNAFDSKLADDYMINSIPRFILINPEGQIIDANAERPSGDIKERLKSLLDSKQA